MFNRSFPPLFVALFALCLAPTLAFAQPYRTINGSGNNVANPNQGRAGVPLLRVSPASYADGSSTLAGPTRPSPRAISNSVAAQSTIITNDSGASDMLWQWGQFLDHDIDLTPHVDAVALPAEVAPISVPTGDIFFDPTATGTVVMPFTRSVFASGSDPRQQLNEITAYIDASNVYGSDALRASTLRLNDGSGKLRTSAGNLLPFNNTGLPNAPSTAASFFLAGDIRANEQVGLTALHTLFVREHNRLCDEIALAQPSLTGNDIYENARATVGALMQVITYNEFLPLLLGPGALDPYTGYDANVNAEIANEFSTSAYRVGHTMLSAQLLRYTELGAPIVEGNLPLASAFFDPNRIVLEGGIEPLLRGLASQFAQRIDALIVDDVRNFLFGPPGSGGLDLASLNIQRGRDHGLASYNDMRASYGLTTMTDFTAVTANVDMQNTLQSMYTDVNDVDSWVGGLAEDHVPGAMVGPLFHAILKDQFERLRDGDRFFYAATFSGAELTALEATRLSDVIKRNTLIVSIADDVFRVRNFQRGDCNQDGGFDLADAIRLLSYLFAGTNPLIGCEDACDTNDDGVLDISDVVRAVSYLFAGGLPLNAPFNVCGIDPTADALGCYRVQGCP
ncbi:MAG: peroxidase family protein [Planctomycetota bacterium]